MDFWIFMLLFVIIFFPRLYIHYVGQWMLVNLAGFPPAKFVFYPYTVDLSYQEDNLSTGMTVGVVVMGPLFNIFVFSLLSGFAFLATKIAGAFPGILSKGEISNSIITVKNHFFISIISTFYIPYSHFCKYTGPD